MLQVNQLIGFGAHGVLGAWATVVGPLTMDSNPSVWNGYAIRQIIDDAQLAFSGGSLVRVTFDQNGGGTITISDAFIGRRAAAGDAYDFAEAPTRLLFGGANGSGTFTTTKLSDAVAFSIDGTRDLIVSYKISGLNSMAQKTTQTGWSTWYKSGGDPSVVDDTGYTDFTATSNVLLVKTVERFG